MANPIKAPRNIPIIGQRRRVFVWNPQLDITPYELAHLLPVMLLNNRPGTTQEQITKAVEGLHPNLKRHFTEIDPMTGKPVKLVEDEADANKICAAAIPKKVK